MIDPTTSPIAVLDVQDDLQDFSDMYATDNEGIHWLLKNLPFADEEDTPIDVVVRATTDGVLYDVFLNGKSVGFRTVGAYCDVLSGLEMPEILFSGCADDVPDGVDGYVLNLLGV